MSQDNVEIARAAVTAWNEGDMEALARLYDSDAVMRTPPGWPEPGPFRGREAIFRQFEQLRSTWDNADTLETTDFVGHGDRVVVKSSWRARGRGPDFDLEMSFVYTMREAMIVAVDFFEEHAEALEMAGLKD